MRLNEREVPIMAQDNHGNEYKVKVYNDAKDGKLVVRIEDTPGSWYLSTLIEGNINQSQLALDWGQNWYCINMNKVMREVLRII